MQPPQEAESAGRMAAKLMAKHQIDLGDLEEEALKEEFDLTMMQARACRPGKKNPKVIPPWIGIIAWGVKIYTRTRIRSAPGQVWFQGATRGRRARRMASRTPSGKRL